MISGCDVGRTILRLFFFFVKLRTFCCLFFLQNRKATSLNHGVAICDGEVGSSCS